MKKVLYVGSGPDHIGGRRGFDKENWQETRLDIEPAVQPDIIGSMTDMGAVETGSIDAIYSSHNLEHLVPHELPVALAEFLRVLKEDGYLVVTCPDLQGVAKLVAQDKLDEPAYYTGAGMPIAPMDILFGWRHAMANGQPYMAHRMGFTAKVLAQELKKAGFASIAVCAKNDLALYAVASKKAKTNEYMQELFNKHWNAPVKTNAPEKKEPVNDLVSPAPAQCSPALSLERLYLDTLKKSLLGSFYIENDVRLLYCALQAVMGQKINPAALSDPEHNLRQLYEMVLQRINAGEAWYHIPVKDASGKSHTLDLRNMTDFRYATIGNARMDNIEHCLDIIRIENIPGDLMETGVCRGGAVIFMAGYLKAWKMMDRKIWAADSYESLPVPSAAADAGCDLSKDKYPVLAVSLERIMETFKRYDLLTDNLRFLRGWFRDTLPGAPVEKLALLRLDGDLYESTRAALVNMYDKVVPGGFIIVDDYGVFAPCKKAIDEFRAERNITAQMMPIDASSVYWRKE